MDRVHAGGICRKLYCGAFAHDDAEFSKKLGVKAFPSFHSFVGKFIVKKAKPMKASVSVRSFINHVSGSHSTG